MAPSPLRAVLTSCLITRCSSSALRFRKDEVATVSDSLTCHIRRPFQNGGKPPACYESTIPLFFIGQCRYTLLRQSLQQRKAMTSADHALQGNQLRVWIPGTSLNTPQIRVEISSTDVLAVNRV